MYGKAITFFVWLIVPLSLPGLVFLVVCRPSKTTPGRWCHGADKWQPAPSGLSGTLAAWSLHRLPPWVRAEQRFPVVRMGHGDRFGQGVV